MSQIKDKKIAVYEITTGRDLSQNEIKVKRYIHDRNGLWAYARELSEKEKFSAKAMGSEQSTLFKVNHNKKIRAGMFAEFKGSTFVIQSIDGYEFYERDLTLRTMRCKAEVHDCVEYDEQ